MKLFAINIYNRNVYMGEEEAANENWSVRCDTYEEALVIAMKSVQKDDELYLHSITELMSY